jgi:DNA adenine methylase
MIGSPLRYPGGKARLFPFFVDLINKNNLFGAEYCEPYAGGAGLALKLLVNGFVDKVALNDIDPAIYAFWISILNETDAFCRLIERTPVTVEEWYHQRKIWTAADLSKPLELGFAAYFLNRTSRSGIIEGAGPIGGYAQSGEWKIDVRLVKDRQIDNIRGIAAFSKQIKVTKMDALLFIKRRLNNADRLCYLDPPYYVKGSKLYKNFYNHADHVNIANVLRGRKYTNWLVSYDDVPAIREIYHDFAPICYSLPYSAGRKTVGREVIYLSDTLEVPSLRAFKVAA